MISMVNSLRWPNPFPYHSCLVRNTTRRRAENPGHRTRLTRSSNVDLVPDGCSQERCGKTSSRFALTLQALSGHAKQYTRRMEYLHPV